MNLLLTLICLWGRFGHLVCLNLRACRVQDHCSPRAASADNAP